MKDTVKFGLFLGCSLMALAPAALAQQAEPQQATTLDDIVVTAGKRSERLRDVPVAVTVVPEEVISQQNITEASDLSRAVPAFSGGRDQLRIRGVGTFSFARSSEASVGVVIDGVAQANAGPVSPQLFDVARVEVLAGPQGTLFGRNASAGVLNVVTNAPDPSGFEAVGHVDVGSRNNLIVQSVLNMPINDSAAVRLTASFVRQPDRVTDVVTGDPDTPNAGNIRGRLLWEPTPDLTLNLIADYSRTYSSDGGEWAVYRSTPGSALTTLLNGCGISPSVDNEFTCLSGDRVSRSTTSGISAQIDYQAGSYLLTSITAGRAYDEFGQGDADSTPINLLDINDSDRRIRNFSQEFRITSPGDGKITYVAGLYYFDSDQTYSGSQAGTLGLVPLPLLLGQSFATDAHSRSYAAFGQSTVRVSDVFRLLVGGRVNRDEVSASTTRTVYSGAIAPFASVDPVSGSTQDDSFSYRLGAQYDLNPTTMAYLTYNRGYKGPAINDQAASSAVPVLVRPEIPHAWELGLKASVLDGRLGINAAAFHTRTTDFQTQYYDPTIPGYVFGNAPELTTQGISIDGFGRAGDFSFSGGAIYTDATYGDGYFVACSQGQTVAQGCLPVAGGTTQDAGGYTLAGVPKWKVTSAVEYSRPIAGGWEGYGQLDVVYNSRIFYGQGFDPFNSTDSHVVVGARVGARTEDGRFGAAVYVRNLFDERVPNLTFAAPLAAFLGDPSAYVQFFGSDSFRVVGLSLDARF